ncbi:putative esterase KAI2 [Glycine max]|nr:putative esterase KAI2 [Glycine max]
MTIVGKGNEIVILTHGFGTDQSVWKHLVPHLVDDYRVVLYDNIGAGTTNPDYFDNIGAGTYSPSCKSFRCNLASSLVTLSPLWWASSLPSLTLISSPNSSSSLLLKARRSDPTLRRNPIELQNMVFGVRSAGDRRDMDSVAVQEFSRTLFNMRPDIALSLAQTIFQLDMRPILSHLTVPCHIIQNTKCV